MIGVGNGGCGVGSGGGDCGNGEWGVGVGVVGVGSGSGGCGSGEWEVGVVGSGGLGLTRVLLQGNRVLLQHTLATHNLHTFSSLQCDTSYLKLDLYSLHQCPTRLLELVAESKALVRLGVSIPDSARTVLEQVKPQLSI